MIKQLSLSSQKEIAVVTHSAGVNLYRFKNGKIADRLYSWTDAECGCFYNDELYLVLLRDKVPDIYLMDIESNQINARITTNGADHCIVDGDKMYYTRYKADGIWSYIAGEKDAYIIDIAISNSHNSWFLSDRFLWYVTPKDGVLKKVDISNGTNAETILENVESIHKELDTVYYTTFDLSPNQIHLLSVSETQSPNTMNVTSWK